MDDIILWIVYYLIICHMQYNIFFDIQEGAKRIIVANKYGRSVAVIYHR